MTAPYVKICGMTRLEDVLAAIDAGADALGFNFYPRSPRFVKREDAERMILEVPPTVHKVGVFVNTRIEEVIDLAVALSLDCVQFHGSESPAYCNQLARPWYKVFRLRNETELAGISAYKSDWLMVDTYSETVAGGTGRPANWDLAVKAKALGKLILAGGLNVDTIEAALAQVRPQAVDVASGVEKSPGIKDQQALRTFIGKVKSFNI